MRIENYTTFIDLKIALSVRLSFLLLLFSFVFFSCGTSRFPSSTVIIGDGSASVSASKASKIVEYAKTFEGTRYKFGGTDTNGMDCSGLVYVSFKNEQIELPRISRDMATKGIPISLKDVEKGDLVFFKTNRKKKVINHVGLVVENKKGVIQFIHSSTSAGVIISSLEENYWKNAFVEVRRII